jgi:glycosyltransferase involved in cell wall biosynthesis
MFFYFPELRNKKYKTIYLAPTLEKSNLDTCQILNKYNIQKKYLLHISGKSEYKNTDLVIESFKKLDDKTLQLVIVGKSFIDIEKQSCEGIIFTGVISDEELSSLLSKAEVLLFVSFYEGFGLPILEAFSLGVPVIAAKSEVNQEIFKDYPFYIDKKDPNILAEKIKFLLSTGMTIEHKGALELFSKNFDWKKVSSANLEFYTYVQKDL